MWHLIKFLLFSSRQQTLKLDDSFTTDPLLLAKGFNNCFSAVGALLAVKTENLKENTFKNYTVCQKKNIFSALFQPNKSFKSF